MKTILVMMMVGAALGAGPMKYETLESTNGKTYEKVTVRKVEPDGLRIMHSAGMAKLKFEELPESVQLEHGYDESQAAAYEKKRAAQVKVARAEARLSTANRRVQEAERRLMEGIEKTAMKVRIEVVQNPGGGYVRAKYWEYANVVNFEVRGLSKRPMRRQKWIGPSEPVIVHGLGKVVDGAKWAGVIYPAGAMTYTTAMGAGATVKQFATTKEKAIKLLNAN